MKKVLTILALVLLALALTLTMVACDEQGPQGPQGEQGLQGIQGIQGENGNDGHSPVITIGSNGNWFIDGVDTNVSASGSNGDDGEKGTNGTSCRTGHGIPENSLGIDGDSYINLATLDLYVKKNGVWSIEFNIRDACLHDGTPGLKFEISSDLTSYYVVGAECEEATDIVIPALYNGLPVIGFMQRGDSRFKFYKAESITLPATIQFINMNHYGPGFSAWTPCLTEFKVDIDNESFVTIDGNLYAVTDEEELVLTGYATGKQEKTFVVPDGVVGIQGSAINNAKFETMILPNGLRYIGDGALWGLDYLTSLSIPASVEYIGDRELFVNNHVINSIQVDPQNETYKSIDGNLYKKTDEGLILLKYAQGKEETEFVVPDGVVEIGKAAFYRANLETIVLPNGLKRISDRAFGYLYKVANIMIPSSVEYIDGGAFVPDGTSISIQVDPQNETYKSIDGNLYEKTDKGLILISYNMDGKGETEFVVPDGVVEIGEGAFWSANLETLVLPDGLTNIQEHAFMNSVINKIIIPDSLEVIGETVFYRDDILMEVYYTGTEEQWKAIVIADGNTWLENATIYYNYTPAEN